MDVQFERSRGVSVELLSVRLTTLSDGRNKQPNEAATRDAATDIGL